MSKEVTQLMGNSKQARVYKCLRFAHQSVRSKILAKVYTLGEKDSNVITMWGIVERLA
jgi:hypothetical protein